MKIPSRFPVSGALVAAAALVASGCRTIRSSDSYYPTPQDGVATPAATPAETPVAPVAIADAPIVAPAPAPAPVAAPAATPAPAPAAAPAEEAGAYPSVLPASQVGTPGTYRKFVITEDGANKPFSFESDGLQGQTGRHVPAPEPAPEPKAVVAPAPAGAGYYVVQEGDIFGRIAARHRVTQKALREANPSVKDPNRLHVGQKLVIPAAPAPGAVAPAPEKKPAPPKKAATLPPKPGYEVYVVKENDILGRVARRHGTTVKAIVEANGLADAGKIRVGQPLYVPSAAAQPPAPAPVPEPVLDAAVPEPGPLPPPPAPAEDLLP